MIWGSYFLSALHIVMADIVDKGDTAMLLTDDALTGAPTLAAFSFTAALGAQRMTLHSRQIMLALSYAIEDIAASVQDTTLIAAFQRLSFVRPQLARYTALTPQLAHTYILGLPDAALPALPHTTMLPLEETWPMLHQWVVLATGPACCVGLFAQDADADQPAQRSRHYQGCWTTDATLVDAAEESFLKAIGQPYRPQQRDARALQEATRRVQQAIATRLRSVNARA
jgi:DICT domain-containing protein